MRNSQSVHVSVQAVTYNVTRNISYVILQLPLYDEENKANAEEIALQTM